MDTMQVGYRLGRWLCWLALAAVFYHGAVVAQGQYDVIARNGELAPGTTGTFLQFEVPIINALGQVAYRGHLVDGFGGVTSGNNAGLWRSTTLVARKGGVAGGTTGTYASFGDYFIDDSGRVGFEGRLLTGSGGVTGDNDEGIWRDSTLVAREGSAANGVAGFDFGYPGLSGDTMSLWAMSRTGQTAYYSIITDGFGSQNSGIWRDSTVVARTLDPATGTPKFFATFFGAPHVNNVAQVAYIGKLDLFESDFGIWRNSTLIARKGDAAGGTAGVFDSFIIRGMNDAGDVLHRSQLLNGQDGVTAANDGGLWRNTTLIAREGSQAPGTNGTFGDLVAGNAINNAGQVAYAGALNTGVNGIGSDNDNGLWLDATLIAREGNAAAGAPAGAVFAGAFSGPYLNNGGQMLVRAGLRVGAGGVSADDDEGLWLFGPGGDGLLVARKGDTFDGRTLDGFLIEAATFQSTGPADGRPSLINDFAQVSYIARFTDGSESVVRFTPEVHWTTEADGSWDAADNWTLSIRPGDPHDVYIRPIGNYTVSGPSGEARVRNLTLGGGPGIATLALDAGTLAVDDQFLIGSTGVLTGTGVIDGAVINTGEVRARNVTIHGGLTNHGLVQATSEFVDRINASLDNAADGEVRVGSGESLYLIGDAHTNGGRVDVYDGAFEADGAVTNTAGGQIFVEDATMRFNDGLMTDGQVNVTFGRGTFTGDISIGTTGQFILSSNSNTTFFDAVSNGGELRVSAGSVATFFGDVSGPGIYTGTGTKFYEALFSPGASPGLVIDEGDVLFGTGAIVDMEIGGRELGTEYDHYDVAGLLGLNGTLIVSLINGFSPEAGDVFDLFNWGFLSGEFLTIDLSAAELAAGLQWNLDNLYTDGSLSVTASAVPLPGALWLLISGLFGVVLLRGPRR